VHSASEELHTDSSGKSAALLRLHHTQLIYRYRGLRRLNGGRTGLAEAQSVSLKNVEGSGQAC